MAAACLLEIEKNIFGSKMSVGLLGKRDQVLEIRVSCLTKVNRGQKIVNGLDQR